MTGWIILGVVLALILLFLFSNVRLFFRYDNGDIFLQARWLFVRYQILPEPERRRKKKKRENKEKEEKNVPSSKIGLVREEGTEKENQSSDEKKQSSQIAGDEKTGKWKCLSSKRNFSCAAEREKEERGFLSGRSRVPYAKSHSRAGIGTAKGCKAATKAFVRSFVGTPAGFSADRFQRGCSPNRHRLWQDERLGSRRLCRYQPVCPDEKGPYLGSGGLFIAAGSAQGVF